MTTTAAEPAALSARRDLLGAWCGGVLIFGAVATPFMAWLAPMGFAPLLALMGLLSLPAFRMRDEDRPGLIALFALLIWAAASTSWSPYRPTKPQNSVALKLALELITYWAAVCGARRADPRLRGWALRILAWGVALLGVELLAEAATGAGIYRRLHESFYEPIRPDLARKNIAQSSFVLALLWPAALAAGLKRPWEAILVVPAAAGALVTAHLFLSDAPVLAAPVAVAVGAMVLLAPRVGPWLMGAAAGLLFMVMPAVVWLVRRSGDYGQIEHTVQVSWSMRMSYWSHALDWIADRPIRGWGLDASRTMGPGIQLHPHNGALQVWLELGAVGALMAAVFWGLTLARLARDRRSLAVAGLAGSTAVYLMFGALNFGVWQEWWLGLGALLAVIATALPSRDLERAST